jgi:hypothetical protein
MIPQRNRLTVVSAYNAAMTHILILATMILTALVSVGQEVKMSSTHPPSLSAKPTNGSGFPN